MINNYVSPDDKIYFAPGDICIIKQDIPYKPKMVVSKIERSIIKKDNNPYLRGVKCRWFTESGFLQEAVFSTKDLLKITEEND